MFDLPLFSPPPGIARALHDLAHFGLRVLAVTGGLGLIFGLAQLAERRWRRC